MKVIHINEITGTDRQVDCPKGGFTSLRFLLDQDKMGFTITKTLIPVGDKQHWHYKNHLEACFCIAGSGTLTNVETGETHPINKDVLYVLDNNDEHYFQAHEDVELICVFNPPLQGREVHKGDGSYGV